MINVATHQNIERSGVCVEGQFKIHATAKAFRILSDGLYSDKIQAIMRELSCNAYDSHIAAKNDKPFTVHMPNELEPYFSIRDYGTGLSHDDIMNIFTTYFQSTKTDSNDYVGCLGLGSKSPFSYTDNFTVSSWHNGVKRTYNAFINESEIPSIAMMAEDKTKDHNGIEIQFPVQRHDFSEFVRKAPKTFKYFKLQPEIVGVKIKLDKPNYFLHKNTWGVRSNELTGDYSSGAFAVMGNVCYPIDDYPEANLTPMEKCVLDLGIDIHFDIGDLEVSASREKLSYNTQTKKNIKDRLAIIGKEIITELETKIQRCPSLWEARKMAYTLSKGDYSMFGTLLTNQATEITWQGNKVDLSTGETIRMKDTEINVVEAQRFHFESHKHTRPAWFENTPYIPISDKTYFLVKDETKNALPRCVKLMEELKAKHSQTDNYKIHIVVIKELAVDGIKTFKKAIGMNDTDVIPLISTLPFDATANVSMGLTANPKNFVKILQYNNSGVSSGHYQRRSSSIYWDNVNVDLDAGGVYVSIDRYKVNGSSPTYHIRNHMELLKIINIDVPVIYGVKLSEIPNIQKRANWIPLENFTRQHLTEYFSKLNILDAYGYSKEVRNYEDGLEHSNRYVYTFLKNNGKALFKDRPEMKAFLAMIKKSNIDTKLFEKVKNIDQDLADSLLVCDTSTVVKEIKDIYTNAKKILDDYPMLTFLIDRYGCEMEKDNLKIIQDYLELVDEKKIKNA